MPDPLTPAKFRAAYLALLNLKVEADDAALVVAKAEQEIHRMAVRLLKATGAVNLSEVFADDPAMLEALRAETWRV